jgi:N-terminal domain of galactosyltransferase
VLTLATLESMTTTAFSLVTACMNREAHLRASLTRWLSLPFISEIIIVDWSNKTPLSDLAAIDDRIRVMRVVDEPCWMLPYAFNLGMSLASNEIIIKSDADSAPKTQIRNYEPNGDSFFAGNWQSGQVESKSAVNGQCVIGRAQFEKVNGYSELMRVYGHEDQDFYSRLAAAGYTRREIEPAMFDVIHHSDGERLANQTGIKRTNAVDAFLDNHVTFSEMQNFYIGKAMPWGPWFVRAQYETLDASPRTQILRRRRELEIKLPMPVAAEARKFATRYILKHMLNIPASVCERLEEAACRDLIEQCLVSRVHPG